MGKLGNDGNGVRRHTDNAASSLGLANHETFSSSLGLCDAYDVVGNLDELVYRLPQLVTYLARSVEHAGGGEGLVDDRGHDPAEALYDLKHALTAVLGGLDGVGIHLAAAHNALGHLGRTVMSEE